MANYTNVRSIVKIAQKTYSNFTMLITAEVHQNYQTNASKIKIRTEIGFKPLKSGKITYNTKNTGETLSTTGQQAISVVKDKFRVIEKTTTEITLHHNTDGTAPTGRTAHLYINESTNTGIPSSLKGWTHYKIKGIPKISRSSTAGKITGTATYNTITATYTAGENGDVYAKVDGNSFAKIGYCSKGKKISKTFTGFNPNNPHTVYFFQKNEINNVNSKTVSKTIRTKKVNPPTTPQITAEYKQGKPEIKITLAKTGTIYDANDFLETSSYKGYLAIQIEGDCLQGVNGKEQPITKKKLQAGYTFTASNTGIKLGKPYVITVITRAPITQDQKIKTLTITIPEPTPVEQETTAVKVYYKEDGKWVSGAPVNIEGWTI